METVNIGARPATETAEPQVGHVIAQRDIERLSYVSPQQAYFKAHRCMDDIELAFHTWEASAMAEALQGTDRSEVDAFIGVCRRWLDEFEEHLPAA